ncbi:hypothetical protein [Myroides fluvii]|uniref:hypothetical protein n=1 Tax=Myroides fluvii TaxID=2572594 RepID=UPI00131D31E9|nr:hypothetical protein [Myroides fluvii]
MVRLHLTTISQKTQRDPEPILIYSDDCLVKELEDTTSSTLVLDSKSSNVLIMYGQTQYKISLAQLKAIKQTTLHLTADVSIQVRLSYGIKLLDYTNLILASLSGTLAIGYSIFTNSSWREFLFLLGSTIIVLFVFMLLYKQTINTRNYNLRMYATISALVLIVLLIPSENWTLKTLIGLSTLTVITRFIKDYQGSFFKVYNPNPLIKE